MAYHPILVKTANDTESSNIYQGHQIPIPSYLNEIKYCKKNNFVYHVNQLVQDYLLLYIQAETSPLRFFSWQLSIRENLLQVVKKKASFFTLPFSNSFISFIISSRINCCSSLLAPRASGKKRSMSKGYFMFAIWRRKTPSLFRLFVCVLNSSKKRLPKNNEKEENFNSYIERENTILEAISKMCFKESSTCYTSKIKFNSIISRLQKYLFAPIGICQSQPQAINSPINVYNLFFRPKFVYCWSDIKKLLQ